MLTHLDIFGSPRRYFFELLAFFAGGDFEKERLRYFASREGAEDMFDYCQRSKRSCFDIFREFPSAKPSLENILDLVPVLQVRRARFFLFFFFFFYFF
jgi:sulfite reductase alpha subunit-like flavoprotein